MQTSRFTSTLRAASRWDPVARLVETTAGSSWGVMPTATASANRIASIQGRAEQQVDREDRDAEDERDLREEPGEPGEPGLELGARLALPQPHRDLAEPGPRTRRHDDRAAPEPRCTTVPMNIARDDGSAVPSAPSAATSLLTAPPPP